MYIVFIGVFLSFLTVFVGGEKLLLLGAIAGFITRLARPLVSRGESPIATIPANPSSSNTATNPVVPTSSSLNQYVLWTSLFVSPLIGGLVAWAGVLLVTGLADAQLLGVGFEAVNFNEGNPATFALAIVLGATETYFIRLLQQFDE